MKCGVCKSESNKIFEKQILNKYTTAFYRCNNCGFVQTDPPTWLDEAYSSAITLLDIGLIERNIVLRDETSSLIDQAFPEAHCFLDFAGGYGMLTRMMRDKGFDFYRQDIYCENLFAKYFDLADSGRQKFDIVTAFEVFEHFPDPILGVKEILAYGENIIFSTKLAPANNDELSQWWYLSVETGQHLSFYSSRSLEIIARSFGKNYYTNNLNLHVFTSKSLSESQLAHLTNPAKKRFSWLNFKKEQEVKTRKSLLEHDYQLIKSKINGRIDS